MKRDLVIGIVGAAILIAAMVGVFRYEAARAGDAYDVAWTTTTVPGPSLAGETAEGAQSEVTLSITQTNITNLTFVLTWDDDVGTGDEFEITAIDPDGESRTATGNAGSAEVTFDLGEKPFAGRVVAGDERAANAQLAEDHTSNAGTGTWSFVIRLVSADDDTVPVAGVPVTEDTGNTWTLEARQEVYQPVLTQT